MENVWQYLLDKNIYRRQGSAVGVCLGAHVQAGQAEWVWIRILWLVTVIVSTTPDWFLHKLSHHHHPPSQHKNISLSSDTKLFVVMWYKIICCEERTKVFVSCFPVSATFSFNWKLCVVKSLEKCRRRLKLGHLGLDDKDSNILSRCRMMKEETLWEEWGGKYPS